MPIDNIEKLINAGFSLRVAKQVATKLDILSNYMEEISKANRMDIPIDLLYHKSQISRATFFTYFSKREDVFLYQLQILFYEVFCEYKENQQLAGEDAIRLLFDRLAEKLSNERIYLECFIQTNIRMILQSHHLKPLTQAETTLLNLKFISEDQPVLSFGPIIEEIYNKAIKYKEHSELISLDVFIETLYIIFVGGINYAESNKNVTLKEIFRNQLSQFFIYCHMLGGNHETNR